jgi:hypothetical protein
MANTRQHDRDSEIERRIAEAEAAEQELPDLDITQLPIKPMYWHVLVEPMRPKKKHGSLHLAPETQKVEEIQTTIGKIIAIGPTAFTGTTPAGNDLSKDIDRAQMIGAWVMWAKHTGQEIKLRSGHTLRLMDDSELLGVVKDPEEFRHWL